ncbi:uncharacterized protein CMU_011070 [Cryptosporidium muris RN66]|uniref:Protein arginine N-methyltransferase domain-containing protein n=1 Tax=Cryptosporidium muris (strain RN66) TaxID=441375 RepID=B6AIW8_CRYMR|nr:uncharacterized protein CMU_011070 [Cryptosporidium muris RN66]EEA08159.1 hypothetical protein, conserved [Cryptosporidium muris RN66]|eukprot:XP_002142508.1 hypothetical protein [Cryptosporidium muris RN66]
MTIFVSDSINDISSDITEDDDYLLDGEEYNDEFKLLPNAKCLFDDFESEYASVVWKHMKEAHNFTCSKYIFRDNAYDRVILVNYLRKCQNDNLDVEEVCNKINEKSEFWDDERFWKLTLENDRLILEEDCEEEYEGDDDNCMPINSNDKYRNICIYSEMTTEEENKILKKKIKSLSNIIVELQKVIKNSEKKNLESYSSQSNISLTIPNIEEKHIPLLEFENRLLDFPLETNKESTEKFIYEDESYFNSYSHLDIHREMILDEVRTNSYFNFITNPINSKFYFKDKIILDIGTGTGVLSIFAAKSGAKCIAAIDAAENILEKAKVIAQKNGLCNKINFIYGKLENLDLYINGNEVVGVCKESKPPDKYQKFKCDVIISEWMGYCLLYESMLYTILNARDKYLNSMGYIFPSSVCLQICPADYHKMIDECIVPWNNKLYDLDLKELTPSLQSLTGSPIVEIVPVELLRCSEMTNLTKIDIKTITVNELLSLRQPFKINIVPKETEFATSLVISFTTEFNVENANKNQIFPLIIETSPFNKPTHWKQTVLHLRGPNNTLLKAVDVLTGYLTITPNITNKRHIDILIELYNTKTVDGNHYPIISNHYSLN